MSLPRASCEPCLPVSHPDILPRTTVHQQGCPANKYQSRPEYANTGQISPSHEPQLLELLRVFVIVCMFVCCHVENVCYYALLCLFSSWCLLISVNIPVHHTYLTHRFVSFRIFSHCLSTSISIPLARVMSFSMFESGYLSRYTMIH